MMVINSILLAAGLFAACVSAVPVHVHDHANAFLKRDGNGTFPDAGLLEYILALEHLEATFYIQGLERFSEYDFRHAGLPSGTYQIFQEIRNHEKVHVEVLKSILGKSAVPSCEYDFGYHDVHGFLAVSRALENTGVTAYDGGMAEVVDKKYLTAAVTIATIEARHASYTNYISSQLPIPQPFDTPLSMKQVITIAAAFIKSCPYDIGIKPYPALTLDPDSESAGSLVKVAYKAADGAPTDHLYCTFLFGAQTKSSDLVDGKCRIPKDTQGDLFVFVTSDSSKPVDANTIAGPTIFTVKLD